MLNGILNYQREMQEYAKAQPPSFEMAGKIMHEEMTLEELSNSFSPAIATILNRAQREYQYLLEHGEDSFPITLNKRYNHVVYTEQPLLSRMEALRQLVKFSQKTENAMFIKLVGPRAAYKNKERNIITFLRRQHQALGDAYYLMED